DSPARAVIAALSGFALGLAAFTGLAAPLARPTLDNKDPKEERSLGRALAKLGLYGALVAGGLGAVVAVRFFLPSDPANLSINDLLWYERSIAFSSGVTIVVPLAALWLGIYLFVRGHVQSLVNAPVSLHRTHRDSDPNPLVEVLTRVVEQDDPGG